MSIYDNVAYGPKIHGMKNITRIVENSLKDAALWEEVVDRLSEPAPGLSGGQQQRLCIARTLAMKPDVILFGEQLPQKAWLEAQKACRNCDLILVAGSSLEVLPVAGLPMQAIDRGAHLIIINQTPTYLSVRADINILENVVDVIPLIRDQVVYGQTI